jgi:rubrerythrin
VSLPRHAPAEDAEMMLDWNAYRKRRFADLSEQESLALAVSNEEEDYRIYRGLAEGLRENYPASAKVFDEMA